MPFQKVNNTNYYYELHGTGKPVVLISGYTCDHTFWLPMLDQMSEHYQVLLFDNRGCGQTKDQNQPLNIKELAAETIALAESLGLKLPHIIGQSMGGTIAQTIAANHSDQIDKLCLLTTTSKWRKAMLMGLRSILTMRQNDRPFDEIFNAINPWVFGEKFLSDKENLNKLYDIITSDPHPQSVKDQERQYALLEDFDGTKQLEKIQASTLVVNGLEDLISLPLESKILAKETKAIHKTLEVGHVIVAEAPNELFELIHDFLGKPDPKKMGVFPNMT